jgi:hypothetical protein
VKKHEEKSKKVSKVVEAKKEHASVKAEVKEAIKAVT